MNRMAQLEKLLAAEPLDTFVLYSLGQEHAKAKNHAAAVEWYDKCLAVDPLYAYAYFHKARALEAAGNIEAAIKTLREGLTAARTGKDQKALSEIGGYLDQLT